MKIGLLVSGRLGTVALNTLWQHHDISFVLTDRNSPEIIRFCEKNGVLCFVGNPRSGKARLAYPELACEVLVSINYIFLIETDLIGLPEKMAINFHGSLLPKYRGRTPHVWAIINNEKETGITAHQIVEACDAGPIIGQRRIPIDFEDTGGSILAKFEQVYPEFVLEILEQVEAGTYRIINQDDRLATSFGKRSPEDGQIDWRWQKERIRNWIRAQAKPYPGAFTFLGNDKIVVHRVEFSDFGFDYMIPNGTILIMDRGHPVVKTSNGAIRLLEYDCPCNLQAGNLLI